MPIAQAGFISQDQVAAEVARATAKLGPEVVRVRFSLQNDTGGEPAIYFRVTLTDDASRSEVLGDVASRVRQIIRDELMPLENWGLFPYFHFRNESEQTELRDPAWL